MNLDRETVKIWVIPFGVWIALLALLAITVATAYVPLGAFNTILNMGIAVAKIALIVLFFMKILTSRPLIQLACMVGLFWLILMFVLTAGDYLTRS
jgi:cytochrome c oxidase subunit 4